MKFCKDCAHFRPASAMWKVAIPDACHAKAGTMEFDPVTGREITYAGLPSALRADRSKCGLTAKWFKPATLDGRLAVLDDSSSADIELRDIVERDR